ncbi:MAG: hypothetical protein ACO26C_05150, partial [Ilumatobacteraceae bacterium]
WPSVWGAIRTWWWIVPLTALAGTAIMWVRDSDLKVTPDSYVVVGRSYEPLDEMGVLVAAGLDPALLNPVPNETNQMLLLQSEDFAAGLRDEFGDGITVLVNRTEPDFSISAFQREDRSNKFSFVTTGRPSYDLSCREATLDACPTVLDRYAARLVEIRADAARRGLDRTESVLRGVLEGPGELTDAQRSDLAVKLAAIDAARGLVAGEMELVRESTTYEGTTVTTVEGRSYWFGALVGLGIGLLILAQLGLSDRRIRGARRLARAVGPGAIAGTLAAAGAATDTNDVPVAAALLARAADARTTGLRVVPVGPVDAAAVAARRAPHAGGARATAPIAAATLADLRPGDATGVVIAVEVGRSRIDDAIETWRAWERAGNAMLGVVLVARGPRGRG